MDISKLLLSLSLLAAVSSAQTHAAPITTSFAAAKTIPAIVSRCGFTCVLAAYPSAVLSRGAYGNENLVSWNGWERTTVHEDFWSGYRASVYRNDVRKEFVVAYSGTDSPSDLLTGFGQYFGILPSQYLYAGDTALDVITGTLTYPEFSDYTITYAGHSLGGGLAQFTARVFQGRAITFNPVAISSGVADEALRIRTELQITSPELLGEAEQINHVVTRNEYGEYDWVSSLLGALWGTTHALEINEFDGDLLFPTANGHSIHTIIGSMEAELGAPPFGGLTLKTDWSCQDAEYDTSHWYVFGDGRIDNVRNGTLGLWWLDRDQVTISIPNGTTYTGTFDPQNLTLTGSMRNSTRDGGCWTADLYPL